MKNRLKEIKSVFKIKKKQPALVIDYSVPLSINLCCGPQKIPGYLGIDFLQGNAEIILDLRYENIPLKDNSVDNLICISSINYFKYNRAIEIIKDIYRIMKPGGMVRFAVQDLKIIAKKYIEKDRDFFFQKLPNGKDRFEGATMADKMNSWFYGFEIMGNPCQYVYDYESLEYVFKLAGFRIVEEKKYMESKLKYIELIDNRPEQMFFLEAIK